MSRFLIRFNLLGFPQGCSCEVAAWGGSINYNWFNRINSSSQDFEEGTNDLVIDCKVLRAIKYMTPTIKHVRQLLKPDRNLLLVRIPVMRWILS